MSKRLRLIADLQEAANPEQAWEALPPAARQAIRDALQVARVETSVTSAVHGPAGADTAAASADICGTNVGVLLGYSLLGNHVITYRSQTDWCWDGQVITSQPFFNASGSTHWLGWEFKGNISMNSQGGIGSNVFKDHAQGKFSLCFGEVCLQHRSPWINKDQHGSGHKSWSGGG